jgi:hypothetical protein
MAKSTCRKCGAVILNDFSRDATWYSLDDQWRAWKCKDAEEHEPNIKLITTGKKAIVLSVAMLHGIAGLTFLVIVGAWSSDKFRQFPLERWVIAISGLIVWFSWMYKVSKWVNEHLDGSAAHSTCASITPMLVRRPKK